MPNRPWEGLCVACAGTEWWRAKGRAPEQDCLMASFLTPSLHPWYCESRDILALSEMVVSFF